MNKPVATNRWTAWLAALVFGVEQPPCKTVAVDMLEVNTIYDSQTHPVFTQVIAWQIMPSDGRHHNVGWRAITTGEDWPIRNGSGYSVTVIANNQRLRIVSNRMRRSHTQRDPERDDTQSYWHGLAPNVFAAQEAPFVPDSAETSE